MTDLRNTRKKLAGVTVMELLVAIGMVVTLACLMWPAIHRVRERAQAAKCASNLRQVGAALLGHSAEHKGLIPPRIATDPVTGLPLAGTYWHQVLKTKGYLPKESRVHLCPGLAPDVTNAENAYGMRRWRTPGVLVMDTTQNLLIIEQQSDFFLLVDSYRTDDKTQGYFVGLGSGTYRVRLAHGEKANTLFADGHVAPVAQEYFEELPDRQRVYQNALPYTFWPQKPQ